MAGVGLAVAASYLALGAVQRGRAVDAQAALAASRGHQPERIEVMPTLGNLVVWRALYAWEGEIYADRIRVGLTGEATVRAGWALAQVGSEDLTAAERARAGGGRLRGWRSFVRGGWRGVRRMRACWAICGIRCRWRRSIRFGVSVLRSRARGQRWRG